MKKYTISLIFLILLSSNIVFANEIELTRSEVSELGLTNSSSSEGLRESIVEIWEAMHSLNQYISYLSFFGTASEKKEVSSLEQQVATLSYNLDLLTMTQDNLIYSFQDATDMMLVNYFYLKEMLDILDQSRNLENQNFENVTNRYALGLVSYNNYLDASETLDISNLSYMQNYYQYLSLEAQIKQFIGFSIDDELNIDDTYLEALTLEPLEHYINIALVENSHILEADLKLNELEQIQKVYRENGADIMLRIENNKRIELQKLVLEERKLEVQIEITNLYNLASESYDTFNASVDDYELSRQTFVETQSYNGLGIVTSRDVGLAKLNMDMKYVEMKHKYRQYYSNVEALARSVVTY